MNACTRARKCLLVPYKETSKDQSGDMRSIEGCCPGQTKHHMIPGAYFNNRIDRSGCNRYNHSKAPTVCAEGTSHSQGSHGAMHTFTNKYSKKNVDNSDNTISYEKARDASIKAHIDTFPFGFCSPDCLRAQLDDYFKGPSKCLDSTKLKFVKIGADNDEVAF